MDDMTERETLKSQFIARSGWQDATVSLLAGDASNRRYDRLQRPDGTGCVLMDAPPEKGEDTEPFIAMTTYLTSLGLSAPKILKADSKNGFLLIEDLGDDLYSKHILKTPGDEQTLYRAALDALIHLQGAAAKTLPRYDAAVMSGLAGLSVEWYATAATGMPDVHAQTIMRHAMSDALHPLENSTAVVVLRDYHAENLIWLPDRDGVARVGLLDFQDAMLGHPLYDVVSILQDARRDVRPELETELLAYFITQSGANSADSHAAYAALGAQRALRIIGVFTRLCIRDGKGSYIDLIPRVWAHLQRNLAHPNLENLASVVAKTLAQPTPEILDGLRKKCPIPPAQS
ncbi:MAG: aminoglycoside phosphotransferase family protein [Roseobacter sp.]